MASMVASLSLLASTKTRARPKVPCERMLAYRKLLRIGSSAASCLASRLQHAVVGNAASLFLTFQETSDQSRCPACLIVCQTGLSLLTAGLEPLLALECLRSSACQCYQSARELLTAVGGH